MKKKLFIIPVIVVLVVCSVRKLTAQTFQRIENYAGLSLVEQNNGVAVADFDADGDIDMFVVAKAQDVANVKVTHSKLFQNNNDGTFTNVTEGSGLENLFPEEETGEVSIAFTGFKFGAFWGDYDNDGFPDIFFTHTNKMQLFHNNQDGTFTEVTTQAGFKKYNDCINTGATWFDYNNDGLLDIFVADWDSDCEGNRLYKNNGNGTFSNESRIIQNVDSKHSYQSIPFDFNNDGWLDLYLANDFIPGPNELFINNQGESFTEHAAGYGLDTSKGDMGVTIGDYNNDGKFDIYVTTIGDNVLMKQTENNSFEEMARTFNIYNAGWAWDVSFSDFDLDRDEDLFIVNGFDYPNSGDRHNVYFENLLELGSEGFKNSSEATGLNDEAISVTEAVFDYDNDGDLDIFVTNNDRTSFFYENKTTDFTQPNPIVNWFKVKLQGTTSNRDAVGTTVSVTTASGTLHRFYTGKGFLSQHLKPVHFGLGADTEILELTIKWPSGIVETHNNIAANTNILAIENNGYQVINPEPSKKVYGCTNASACNYNPYATISTGDCNFLSTAAISGVNQVYKNSIESYTYTFDSEIELTWMVTGGEVLEENNNTIVVQWGNGENGQVSLIANNENCTSSPVILDVTLFEEDRVIETHSIARIWNETLLELIRKDYARPTVHARNLFHSSVTMYDAWAIYNESSQPYLIGNEVHDFNSNFEGFETTEPKEEAIDKTISYAMYRLLVSRFKNAPNPTLSKSILDEAMQQLGYDTTITNTNYTIGDPIALGNYIAEQIIAYGLQDGANEANEYNNDYYQPVNEALLLDTPSSMLEINPNRWQPLSFNTFIDQAGNVIGGVTPDFLSPEWGNVEPFSLTETDKTTFTRNGNNYHVYHNPEAPPTIEDDNYKWGFALVSKWASHHTPNDGVVWDISPKSMGNISLEALPQSYNDYPDFYNEYEGGDIGTGYNLNPVTQHPYESQMVPRGDYTRVLAEFWADGPDSETPPGHWFTILNYVNDHEQFEKRFAGEGAIISNLEWDVKSYFILGGAMHDAAISAWSIKGWYDYIRPISAIRYMAEIGQSSNPSLSNYHPNGVPLDEGYIEVITENDALAAENNEHVGKIKLYTWLGHSGIFNPETDQAGVGWILAENWWPYQRPTFVTPPFAGFVSGHSTYSRAAAEVLTAITGTKYFPGGMGEFIAKQNEFLVFEEGPSVDVKLQWATYQDASDQCSLSRIWGGIHPPADDIQGRIIGEKIGKEAFAFASAYFKASNGNENPKPNTSEVKIYPNPIATHQELSITNTSETTQIQLFDANGGLLQDLKNNFNENTKSSTVSLPQGTASGIYILKIDSKFSKIVVLGN
ncbi:hypothetical protein PK35_02595 [Tamlana nanhaiensis]|uniref:ASPIC/UnbV domain-containing protein n=1 Tax=Neotamlana nanhaiensis TaxID=1382798 RepID=A0A0D7W805_9FLAO|nr:FG-GAP-like repeat-containing protein [Tamlana nanhaiensis]KJD34818.1 hypothetical protein PK35_02595 [Tamlana nanhaiensis]